MKLYLRREFSPLSGEKWRRALYVKHDGVDDVTIHSGKCSDVSSWGEDGLGRLVKENRAVCVEIDEQ